MSLVPFRRPTPPRSSNSKKLWPSSRTPSRQPPPPSETTCLRIRKNIDRHQILTLMKPAAAQFLLSLIDEFYKRHGL